MKEEREDPKRTETAKALFGTCDGLGLTAEVSLKPAKSGEKAMRACCTNKGCRGIRNRTLKGVYWITKDEALKFADLCGFDLPPDAVLKEYIIKANF
jgi:hypothetical protein